MIQSKLLVTMVLLTSNSSADFSARKFTAAAGIFFKFMPWRFQTQYG